MTDTASTPDVHSSLVGGSTAARRIGCPGSYNLEQKVPKSRGSSYAREGTSLHEMMAIILDQDKAPEELLPFTHNQPPKGVEEAWSLTISEDLWAEIGQPALDAFDQLLDEVEAETGIPVQYIVEKSCEFPGIDGAFGTSDILWKSGPLMGVVDWKFGRGPVAVEENKQLMFYMRAALYSYNTFFASATGANREASMANVLLAIVQPKLHDEAQVWRTDVDRLNEYTKELQAAVDEALNAAEPSIAKGSWCAFADCKTICPLHLGAVAELGRMMSAHDTHTEYARAASATGQPVPEFDYNAFLSEALEIADDAEGWAKKVAAMAQERIDNGQKIEGWKTVPKRSAGRKWSPELSEEQIKQRLSYRGLKIDDYAPRKIITAPAAEKLLKKIDKDLPKDSVITPPGNGTTLVRDSDEREEAKRSSHATAELAAALASKTEQER